MIVKPNVTLYKCEHCKKKMFVRSAMERHEKNCNSNPENSRACVGCQFIEEIQIPYWYDVSSNEGPSEKEKMTTGFRCKKLNKTLYPFKVERLGLVEKYPETFEGQEPMPKTCDLYQNEYETFF